MLVLNPPFFRTSTSEVWVHEHLREEEALLTLSPLQGNVLHVHSTLQNVSYCITVASMSHHGPLGSCVLCSTGWVLSSQPWRLGSGKVSSTVKPHIGIWWGMDVARSGEWVLLREIRGWCSLWPPGKGTAMTAQEGLGMFLVVLNATDAVVVQQSWEPTTSPLSFSHVAEDMCVRPWWRTIYSSHLQ